MNRLLTQAPSGLDLNTVQQKAFPSSPPEFGVGTTTIGTIISAIIPWIFTIAGMLLLVYLIFGGFQLMTSGGDPKGAGAAKSHITNALVGFIIIFIAYWVVQLFGQVLGLTGIQNIFK